MMVQAFEAKGLLTGDQVREAFYAGLENQFRGQSVLVLISDYTRTVPLPFLFRLLVEVLHDARRLDFMVALGTHPPLSEARLNALVGLTAAERADAFKEVGLFNHRWDLPETLRSIGTLAHEQVQAIAGEHWHPTLGGDVDILINRAVFDYDHILILGPTFPHEIVGFSGGAKYLFPGISAGDMINVTHWLGALVKARHIIGVKETPVRDMIHAATEHVPTPITLAALVVDGQGLAGVIIGDHLKAWGAAADLSAQRHITWVDKPFRKVLAAAAPMYDELWTAGKAMYKLEPALAEGGELIIYAPHLDAVSDSHGQYLFEVGYHVLPYFLQQWERFKRIPLAVLAHSTQVRGDGGYEKGVEHARAKVTLATQLSPAVCEQLALGYRNPKEIDPAEWQGREDEGVLYVAKAGEMLYRVRSQSED